MMMMMMMMMVMMMMMMMMIIVISTIIFCPYYHYYCFYYYYCDDTRSPKLKLLCLRVCADPRLPRAPVFSFLGGLGGFRGLGVEGV